jgi:hypothetical protein
MEVVDLETLHLKAMDLALVDWDGGATGAEMLFIR